MTTSTTYTRLDTGGGVPADAARAIADVASDTGSSDTELSATEFSSVFPDVAKRVLDQAELVELAASVAARPELWRRFVAFDDHDRHFACLSSNEHADVWVLCWTPVNDTGWHDHDVSSGAVAVVQGRVVEHKLAIGRPEVRNEIGAGLVYSFGPDHIHRMSGLDAGSVSIHVYSPPLKTMGQYVVDEDGVLHRTSVASTEELRVLD